MKESFDIGVKLTLNLEGNDAYTADPSDPGGETKYGICKKYNPTVDIKNLTLEQAKEIYYKNYWVPAGCDDVPFPMDLCLFDSQVNPQGGGNKEIYNQLYGSPPNWEEWQLRRMIRYMKRSKSIYVLGHIQRVLRLTEQIYALMENQK